jgi:hypothetical protein
VSAHRRCLVWHCFSHWMIITCNVSNDKSPVKENNPL